MSVVSYSINSMDLDNTKQTGDIKFDKRKLSIT